MARRSGFNTLIKTAKSIDRLSKQYAREAERKRKQAEREEKRQISDLNPTIKGWFGYFKHAHHYTFNSLDGFIRRRLRAILCKHQKRPGSGRTGKDHRLWPNSFFAERGLFTMRKAHILARRSR